MRFLLLLCASALTVLPHGMLDAQIADATRAIAADPGNGQLYVRRGELHRLHRDWPQALADFAGLGQQFRGQERGFIVFHVYDSNP